ncbi:MAG: GspH/FimT family pseudopilin [Gammaproteobacteria bacterium]|nr:prepilin-type N-terminal cleavage/methylation domain-containing protein [Rhodocyclaceae bacterium]MBU3910425.1 GspH/FimT family pseudopilin [Gammaproteobacteria bacterium]MBU4004906.1 GspH/FimT family pseudopilin [Gammaproteobacteria bacterium]MBU4020499.1 GspH/FimT family pseudopilin [Gammaproteobacteria bacterium]MBU4095575.1 GspH/FimT family pseudopilin [Gammaproteobacteria bacterium]
MLRLLSRPRRASGFTLIELMISIIVLGVLLTIAMPSFRAWMLNIQIRNASESILTGIQRARAEAVGRNTSVTFVMAANSTWTVNVNNPPSVIETRLSSEGSEMVTRTIIPASATTLTFSNLGIVVPNSDGSNSLQQIDFTANGANQNMRIVIGAGGSAKMCDPHLPTGSSPRAC